MVGWQESKRCYPHHGFGCREGPLAPHVMAFLSRGNAGPSERSGGRGDEFPVQAALALVAHGFHDATDCCVKASVCHWIETALFAPKQL